MVALEFLRPNRGNLKPDDNVDDKIQGWFLSIEEYHLEKASLREPEVEKRT